MATPATAGHSGLEPESSPPQRVNWIPAFAGMTMLIAAFAGMTMLIAAFAGMTMLIAAFAGMTISKPPARRVRLTIQTSIVCSDLV